MMNSPSGALLRCDDLHQITSQDVRLILRTEHSSVTVDRDGFLIGAHPRCDLRLNDRSIPMWHSVIHIQGGAIWIEAADDETSLVVNDRKCRRMALRHGDHFHIGPFPFSIELCPSGCDALAISAPGHFDCCEDVPQELANLSAEELCDRIVSEQSKIQELSDDKSSGWLALLQAIEAVHEVPTQVDPATAQNVSFIEEQRDLDRLMSHMEQIQETISEQTKVLNEREASVSTTSKLLDASQQDVVQRLDEMIEQLNMPESTNELRASA